MVLWVARFLAFFRWVLAYWVIWQAVDMARGDEPVESVFWILFLGAGFWGLGRLSKSIRGELLTKGTA